MSSGLQIVRSFCLAMRRERFRSITAMELSMYDHQVLLPVQTNDAAINYNLLSHVVVQVSGAVSVRGD